MPEKPKLKSHPPDGRSIGVYLRRIAGKNFVAYRTEAEAYEAAYKAQRKKPKRKSKPK